MSASPHSGHGEGQLKIYYGVAAFLTVVTAVEMLPLFELVHLPGPALLIMSAVKFVVVCLFFMHLWGDKVINYRLFFVPLLMAGATVMVLMSILGGWTLAYQETARGRDSDEVAARYRGRWEGPCNAWAKSPFTGNEYCASPWVEFSTMAAYEAAAPKPVADDPAFAGFDQKSPDEQKAVLMEVGAQVYAQNCAACHQAEGQGVAGVFPPMVNDPVANGGSADEHITIVLKGLSGKVINGVSYASAMTPFGHLSDQHVAAVVTYERLSWGNNGGVVLPAQVAAKR